MRIVLTMLFAATAVFAVEITAGEMMQPSADPFCGG